MSDNLTDTELEFLMNLPDDELKKYVNIPDGDISDIGDEDENDGSVEINTTSESTITNLVHLMEKKEWGQILEIREEKERQREIPQEQVIILRDFYLLELKILRS